jgi:hypothetical protein
MEAAGLQVDGRELFIRDIDRRIVAARVERRLDLQAGGRGGVGNQVDDRSSAPRGCNRTEPEEHRAERARGRAVPWRCQL